MTNDELIAASFGFDPTKYSRQFTGAMEDALRNSWIKDSMRTNDRLNIIKDSIRKKRPDGVVLEPVKPGMMKVWERRDNRRAEVARMHGEGLNFREIVAETKSAESTIREDFRALGLMVTLQAERSLAATARRGEVARMMDAGYSIKEISDSLGIPVASVTEDKRYIRKRRENDAR